MARKTAGSSSSGTEPVNWFDLFPSEDRPQVPNPPTRINQVASTSQFHLSSSATASEFRGDAPPRSLIVPSRFVDAKKPQTSLASAAPPIKRVTSRTWPARRRHSAAWLATALRQPARLTLKARSWQSDRGAWVLGSLVCLVLLLPSAADRTTTTRETIPQSQVPIVARSSSIQSGTPDWLVASPSSASPVSQAKPHVSQPSRQAARSQSARSSAAAQPSAKLAPSAGLHVIGTLVVTSEPAGASVFMNQRYVGITPLKTSVKAGSYALVLELDRARWTDVVLVRGERVTRVERLLQVNRFPLPISPFQ